MEKIIQQITLSDLAAILGMIFGTAGLVLGICNYLRDRAQVRIILQWDMKVTDNSIYDSKKSWAVISVTNIGRRSVFVSNAGLCLPKRYKHPYLLSPESLKGRKLNEGEPAIDYLLDQTDFQKYAKDWNKIRAVIHDSTGKKYYSKINKLNKPSWAN